MKLFHFDIECAAEYKDYETFLSNDESGAKLFEGKWKRMALRTILRTNIIKNSNIIRRKCHHFHISLI